MSLVEHARRELELCGQTAEDAAYADSIIKAVEAFASYGHSGGSASVGIEQLHTPSAVRHPLPVDGQPRRVG